VLSLCKYSQLTFIHSLLHDGKSPQRAYFFLKIFFYFSKRDLKVLTYKRKGGLKVVSFDRSRFIHAEIFKQIGADPIL
jgi:hypothetical protein